MLNDTKGVTAGVITVLRLGFREAWIFAALAAALCIVKLLREPSVRWLERTAITCTAGVMVWAAITGGVYGAYWALATVGATGWFWWEGRTQADGEEEVAV